MSTGRAVEELQEYGDNYYRWLRQGQGLEPAQTQAQGLATVVDGTSDVSNGGSEAISGNASDGDSDGDVDSLGRVDSGGGGGKGIGSSGGGKGTGGGGGKGTGGGDGKDGGEDQG